MKQLFIFLAVAFFQSFTIIGASPVIKNIDEVQKILLSKHEEKLYAFYEQRIASIDLNTLKTEYTLFDKSLHSAIISCGKFSLMCGLVLVTITVNIIKQRRQPNYHWWKWC